MVNRQRKGLSVLSQKKCSAVSSVCNIHEVFDDQSCYDSGPNARRTIRRKWLTTEFRITVRKCTCQSNCVFLDAVSGILSEKIDLSAAGLKVLQTESRAIFLCKNLRPLSRRGRQIQQRICTLRICDMNLEQTIELKPHQNREAFVAYASSFFSLPPREDTTPNGSVILQPIESSGYWRWLIAVDGGVGLWLGLGRFIRSIFESRRLLFFFLKKFFEIQPFLLKTGLQNVGPSFLQTSMTWWQKIRFKTAKKVFLRK